MAPESGKVRAGFAREDLFCVVHEIFQTDTADFADILLPATTQLEHIDVHNSYGHLYVLANNQAIEPLGEALPNTEVFRRLAARMGFTEPCFRDSDEDIARAAFRRDDPRVRGLDWDTLKATRLAAARGAAAATRRSRRAASRRRRASASSSASSAAARPAAGLHPAARIGASNPDARRALSARVHLAAGAQLPQLVVREPAGVRERGRRRRSSTSIRTTRPARGIDDGERVRIFNDRGSFTATARVGERARTGVVVAPSIWWQKLAPDGRNANAVTSQALTDLGRAATFYDCLVEVARE